MSKAQSRETLRTHLYSGSHTKNEFDRSQMFLESGKNFSEALVNQLLASGAVSQQEDTGLKLNSNTMAVDSHMQF
jgi:hypothetical protein